MQRRANESYVANGDGAVTREEDASNAFLSGEPTSCSRLAKADVQTFEVKRDAFSVQHRKLIVRPPTPWFARAASPFPAAIALRQPSKEDDAGLGLVQYVLAFTYACMNAFFHKFIYIIFCGKLWKIASVGRESSIMENGKLWKINVPTGGQQHTFSRRGIGLCASGDHVNGVENLIDFGNRSNFPRRSFFARRRGRERAVGGDNATHYVAQKMNGVENLGRFEQSKISRIVH